MGFSWQEYWSGLPFRSSEDLPNPGIKLRSPVWKADSFTVWVTKEVHIQNNAMYNSKHSVCVHVYVLVTQLCLPLCDPTDCNPPGSPVYGILQARILEWVAILFSRGSSQPRDQTQVSPIAGRFSTVWATREAPYRKYSSALKNFHFAFFQWSNNIRTCMFICLGIKYISTFLFVSTSILRSHFLL